MVVKTAVFMAAGIGSRLKGHFDEKPKGFLMVGDQPIIERSIAILLKQGIERIIIGTGYKSEYYDELAKRYSHVECVKNTDYRNTGSFFTLYNVHSYIKDDFLLLESDLLYEEKAVSFLQNDSEQNIVLASGWTKSGDEFYIEVDKNNNLVNMSKKKHELKNTYGELVGISKISYTAFQGLCRWAESHPEAARTRDYEYCLCQIAREVPIAIKRIDNLLWVEIDDISHLNRALHSIHPKIKETENG